MASRSLTEVFILMRNNAIRNRHIYSEQDNSERMSLISLNDAERGIVNGESPPWIDQLDKAHSTMTKLDTKIDELNELHSRHLHRPTLDDSSEEEALIERVTTDISMMFNTAHRLIQHIKNHSFEGSINERRLTTNVTRALVTRLQELSTKFRSTQGNYLRQINSREQRSKMYFDNDDVMQFEADDSIDDHFVMNHRRDQQQQQQQMLLLQLEEENATRAAEREHEVNNIVRSIVDLNDIFKELAHMVADQGTILDRIDYNIEQTQSTVHEGLTQLRKADAYQRSNRKMCCIIILATTIVLLVILLIIFKT